MDLLKRNMFFLLCGLAAALGIGLAVTGLRAMPNVVTEMKSAETVYQNLDALQAKPVNLEVIEAEDRRIQSIKEDRDKIIQKAQELYPGYIECTGEGEERTCKLLTLVADIFPECAPVKRLEFRKEYAAKMKELFEPLNAGTPSTAAEQQMVARKIEDERAEASRSGADPRLAEEFSDRAPLKNEAGFITVAGIRRDPRVRADIQAAQRISCYVLGVIPEKERKAEFQPSLQYEPGLEDTGTMDPPTPEEAWRGQVAYWIQRDILKAIEDVNAAAAEEAKAAGRERWVGTMPVKDIISIRLGPDLYVPPEGGLYALPQPGGYAPAVPAGTAETVFTHTSSGPYFEVVQVGVKLVMDQRDILKLVERICNNSMYSLVRASYVDVPPNLTLTGKIYGSEPTVNVLLEFEFVMLGDVFRKFMPREVCERHGIQCPAGEES